MAEAKTKKLLEIAAFLFLKNTVIYALPCSL